MVAVKKVLAFAAVSEIATGAILLLAPSLVGKLLFGMEMVGVATMVARVAGIALIGLGVACWPGTPLLGMVTYSVMVALYLSFVGFSSGASGPLLWPAVIAHGVLAALLARGLVRGKQLDA
jgi:hypothetical protein